MNRRSPATVLLVAAALVVGVVAYRFLRSGGDGAAGLSSGGDAGTAASRSVDAASHATDPAPKADASPIRAQAFDDGDAVARTEGPRRVRGRVVRRGGVPPAPQAKVRLRLDGQAGTDTDPHRFATRGTLRSGPDGEFSFGVPEPGDVDTYRVVVVDAAFAGRSALVRVAAGAPDPEPAEIVVDPYDGAIVGFVRDGEGRPIVGATVGFRERTRTAEDGSYRLAFVAGRTAALVGASAPGFATEWLPLATDRPGEQRADFTLRPGGVVEGVVRGDGGAPLAGAEVATLGGFPLSATTTDAEGRFRLEGFSRDLEIMSQEVVARATGYVPLSREPVFTDGLARLEFSLSKGAALGGVVVDHDGSPAAYAEVSLAQPPPGGLLVAVAGRDGRFRFPAALPGPVEARATAPGRLPASVRVDLLPGGREDVRLVLGEAAGFGGVVVDPQGAPLAGITVVARVSGMPTDLRATTDAEGRFRVTGLSAHDHEAEIFGGTIRRRTFRATVGKYDHRVTAEPAGVFSGVVRDAATNAPVSRFVVRAHPPQNAEGSFVAVSGIDLLLREQGRAITAADGVWILRLDAFGVGAALGFEILADGYAPFRLPRLSATREPRPEDAVAALVRGRTAVGVVTTAEGAPVAGVELRPLSEIDAAALRLDASALPVRAVVSDAAGAFRLDDVPDAPLRVRVAAPGRAPFVWGPATPGADPWRIVLPTRGAIRGSVAGAAGAAGVGVVELDVSGSPADAGFARLRATLDGEGRFAFLGLPPGDYQVGVADDGAPTRRLSYVRLAEGESVDVRLGAFGPSSIRVRVETADGSPLPPRATVLARPQWKAVAQGIRAGAIVRCRDGVAEFDGLDAGEYEFHLTGFAAFRSLAAGASLRLAPGIAPELLLQAKVREW